MTLIVEDDLISYFSSRIEIPKNCPELTSYYLATLLASNRIPKQEPLSIRLIEAKSSTDTRNIAEDALLIASIFPGMMSRVMTKEYYLGISSTGYATVATTIWRNDYNAVYKTIALNPALFAEILKQAVR